MQRWVYSQTGYPDPTGSSWVNAMSTGQAEQGPPGRPGHPPGGLSLLTAFNLLTGAGCGCIWLHSAPSPDDADARLLAAGSCVVAVAMLSAGICLLVRRPWCWRVAAGAQLFSSGTQLVLACIGLSMTNTARQKGGDWAGFAVLTGQAISIAPLVPAIVSVAGFFYLRRPRVKAAFYVVTPPKNEA